MATSLALVETPQSEWFFASKDFFGQRTEHEVWCETGRDGWRDIGRARAELSHIRERDEKGGSDATDNYGRKCQAVRHEFRLVRLELTQATTIV